MNKLYREENFTKEVLATKFGKKMYEHYNYHKNFHFYMKQGNIEKVLENYMFLALTCVKENPNTDGLFINNLELVNFTPKDFKGYFIVLFVSVVAKNEKDIIKQADKCIEMAPKEWILPIKRYKVEILKMLHKVEDAKKLLEEIYKESKDLDDYYEIALLLIHVYEYLQGEKYNHFNIDTEEMSLRYIKQSSWVDKYRCFAELHVANEMIIRITPTIVCSVEREFFTRYLYHVICGMIAEKLFIFPCILEKYYPYESHFPMIMYTLIFEKICFCGKKCTKYCSTCKLHYYCSKECQMKDWKVHKLICMKRIDFECKSELQKVCQKDLQNEMIKIYPKVSLMIQEATKNLK